jgi:hypothetical protein
MHVVGQGWRSRGGAGGGAGGGSRASSPSSADLGSCLFWRVPCLALQAVLATMPGWINCLAHASSGKLGVEDGALWVGDQQGYLAGLAQQVEHYGVDRCGGRGGLPIPYMQGEYMGGEQRSDRAAGPLTLGGVCVSASTGHVSVLRVKEGGFPPTPSLTCPVPKPPRPAAHPLVPPCSWLPPQPAPARRPPAGTWRASA